MPVERSAGAVIFRETKKGRAYLLLRHHDKKNTRGKVVRHGHWDFPKGHLEKGETGEDAARREVKEETGIAVTRFTPGFKKTIRYFVKIGDARRLKFVVFFLARTKGSRVAISQEHKDFAWLGYREAYEQLTYVDVKSVLKKVEYFLCKKTDVSQKSPA